MMNVKGAKLRRKPVILTLFMVLWMGSTLFSLDVVLEQSYPTYNPNGCEVFWVGDDTILVNVPIGINSEIILLNIYTKKGKIIKLQPEVNDEKDYYTILAIDREQQKFIFNFKVENSQGKQIKNVYYEYDMASGTMTELVTNTEAFKDFKKGETYFLDLRYYFKYKDDKNTRLTSMVKWDRFTGNEEVIFVEKNDILIGDVYDYDRYRNVLLALGDCNQFYLVPYDGTSCGEPIRIMYGYIGSQRLVWGKYILSIGNISTGPYLGSVALWSSTTKQPQEIPHLFTLDDDNKTNLFAVNHRTNQIAVVGFFDYGEHKFEPGLYIYRVLADGEINDNRVRYRSGPSTSAEILGMFNKNDKVKVIELSKEKAVIDGQEHYWYKVRTRDGKDVWVYGAYLTILE